jgi:hypothetical protein
MEEGPAEADGFCVQNDGRHLSPEVAAQAGGLTATSEMLSTS